MKKFIQNNFTVIVLVIAVLSLFKSCGDSRELSKMRKEVESIKDSTYTKSELDRELKIIYYEKIYSKQFYCYRISYCSIKSV
jgi:hypothetical protein